METDGILEDKEKGKLNIKLSKLASKARTAILKACKGRAKGDWDLIMEHGADANDIAASISNALRGKDVVKSLRELQGNLRDMLNKKVTKKTGEESDKLPGHPKDCECLGCKLKESMMHVMGGGKKSSTVEGNGFKIHAHKVAIDKREDLERLGMALTCKKSLLDLSEELQYEYVTRGVEYINKFDPTHLKDEEKERFKQALDEDMTICSKLYTSATAVWEAEADESKKEIVAEKMNKLKVAKQKFEEFSAKHFPA